MRKILKTVKGFTFLEIIAVIIIVGIIGAIAVSRISSTDTYIIKGELDKVTSHLRYAQGRAIRTNSTWGISFNDASTYWLFQTVGTSSVQQTFAGENANQVALSKLSITSAPQTITFDRFGSPGAADITVTTSGGNIAVASNTGFTP